MQGICCSNSSEIMFNYLGDFGANNACISVQSSGIHNTFLPQVLYIFVWMKCILFTAKKVCLSVQIRVSPRYSHKPVRVRYARVQCLGVVFVSVRLRKLTGTAVLSPKEHSRTATEWGWFSFSCQGQAQAKRQDLWHIRAAWTTLKYVIEMHKYRNMAAYKCGCMQLMPGKNSWAKHWLLESVIRMH